MKEAEEEGQLLEKYGNDRTTEGISENTNNYKKHGKNRRNIMLQFPTRNSSETLKHTHFKEKERTNNKLRRNNE